MKYIEMQVLRPSKQVKLSLRLNWYFNVRSLDNALGLVLFILDLLLELVSKELNHLAAILHVYAGGLNFM